ncbi:BREX-1 system adenine-specific DNA-methyltransferase PglX [Photobacterium carnosum]|uniref:site-specific DNA-methyltransferase (adenine-specific) n=1 Tax=Photobacterium carnosum TaxID=2023717 RepID=A0A2N4UM34_9GAMM|nr:BREX-1 system adenine-specific DNA-methyltransferase PglX [Photobacterium carnosum]PLC56101.1 SAM-dependent methyltransferase [Photobacterium carnosum]
MDTRNIKKYAPVARREFRAAVMQRMNELGLYSDTQIAIGVLKGDAFVVEGKAFDTCIQSQHIKLVEMVKTKGFISVVDEVASTWFNRLCAIRFMELKEYLDHGYRVLSHPTKANSFQILEHAADVAEDLGLNRSEVLEMSLLGDKEEELYRKLLLSQCHTLHNAMDFLFDKVDSVSELLLPEGLTRTDSILRSLVDDVPEDDWSQVEIIGWLYQFYISEKKDEVIGKVVKSEDIPAATQLFTPNWIVQYLVQNSVGRQWLQTYPESSIKAEMPYYIESAEQTDEVNAQLVGITPDSLEPEAIKVLDPACGSGHILVEAYNTLKTIYDERGYRSREIPQLILENNLFGLDIDDRAAQLAGFALMMMAREDDRRIFTRGVKLNVLSLQESANLDISKLWRDLDLNNDQQVGQNQDLFLDQEAELDVENEQFKLIKLIKEWFLQAKTLGSLIDVPAEYQQQLKLLRGKLLELQESGNTAQKPAVNILLPFVQQAWLLSQRYDSVVANPPYMGGKGMNKDLKDFAKKQYPNSKSDLFSMFMERAFELLNETGFNAQINMQSWMFLSSYEKMRESLLDTKTIVTMAHLGARAFSQISGEVVQTTAWVLGKKYIKEYLPIFFRLIEGSEQDKRDDLLAGYKKHSHIIQSDFAKIPGSPIVYWLSNTIIDSFDEDYAMKDICHSFQGIITGDNLYFLRQWYELESDSIGWCFNSFEEAKGKCCWIPYNKGGSYRKWYGNNEHVLRWNGFGDNLTRGRTDNRDFFFKEGLSWSDISSSKQSFRFHSECVLFDAKGPSAFYKDELQYSALGLMNSSFSSKLIDALNPTLSFQIDDFYKIPINEYLIKNTEIRTLVEKCISIAKKDWDLFETSWDFKCNPLIALGDTKTLKSIFVNWLEESSVDILDVKNLEEKNNEIISMYYDLQNELDISVPFEQITLNVNPLYRYGSCILTESIKNNFQSDTISEFVSYFIGCMMGRYSLDREGLVYAHAGNKGFTDLINEGVYKTFPADDDGIIPLTDIEWFSDDATYRFRDFVRTVWGEEHLQQNLDFIAESLCLHAIKPKRGESSLDAIRRYMSAQFYKDHLKTYKKRPIYWLFSSGKQKAFECLVYLHRYNESTLSRMRTEYVTPLLGKYEARLGQLDQQLDSVSISEKTKLKKEITALEKKHAELRTFDDKLKHFADMRISLDLDDGVKVNYGKFGDLLFDVKAIHGKSVK